MSELRNNNESVKGNLEKDKLRLTLQERQGVAVGFLGFVRHGNRKYVLEVYRGLMHKITR